MSEIKKDTDLNKTVKKKRKLSKPAIFLIVGIIIIVVPCLIFGGILLSSAMNTGTPIFGDRYEGDLDPAITSEDMSKIKGEIEALEGVESVDVVLPSGQLRVNINTDDSLSKDEIKELINSAYEIVKADLPLETYFTSSDTKKMYDLAINAYNFINAEDDGMIYYELTKNAMSENEIIQLVSEPLNPELVEEIEAAQNPETAEDTANEEASE